MDEKKFGVIGVIPIERGRAIKNARRVQTTSAPDDKDAVLRRLARSLEVLAEMVRDAYVKH